MHAHTSRPGFMLLDALLGAALFAIFIGAVGLTIAVGQMGFLKTGDASRAVFLAETSLEAVRSIRNANWDALVAGGPYGVAIGPSGTWEFSGSGSTTEDGYTTSVTLTASGTDAFLVSVTTDWFMSKDRTGYIELVSLVTNWRELHTIGDWGSASVEGTYTDDGDPLFRQVLVHGDYAFITSDKTNGGAGLYIFDVSDTSNPQQISASFALPGDGHGMAVAGTNLLVVSEDTTAEVLIYDLSNPATFSAADQLGTVNIPGDGRARSVAYYNGYMYVGATEDGTEHELYSYSLTEDGTTALVDSHDMEGSIADIILKDGYAYMASSENVAELRVVDVFDPTDLQDAPGNGYNLTDVQDATTIAHAGTGLLLGRMDGSVIEEFVLFDVEGSILPSPPPGPYYVEISGDVQDIAVEPGGRYAFIASNFSDKELQIFSPTTLVAGGTAEVDFYNATEMGRGVYYHLAKDRLFFVTDSSLFIFQPN